MARSEGRLQFGMWRGGLDGLSAHAKLVYCVLLTEPSMNHCGVGVTRLDRWAKDASLTIAETSEALDELFGGGWVLLDDDTGEFLVRTLIRNDGIAAQPYVLKGALREALKTESPVLRRVLAVELRKLPPKQPDGVSRKGGKVTYPDPHATAAQLDPPGPPKPTRKAPETLFDENPFESVSSGSMQKGVGSMRGSGGGGGTSPSLSTHLEKTTAASAAAATSAKPVDPAQQLTKEHYDRVPLTPFVAVLKIVKRALAAGFTPERIRVALAQLADEKRPVTLNSLKIALDGRALHSVPSSHQAFRNPDDPNAYDQDLLDRIPPEACS